jgi:hypothetical protein
MLVQEHGPNGMVARNRALGQEETALRYARVYRWVVSGVNCVELRLEFVVAFGEGSVDHVAVHCRGRC